MNVVVSLLSNRTDLNVTGSLTFVVGCLGRFSWCSIVAVGRFSWFVIVAFDSRLLFYFVFFGNQM